MKKIGISTVHTGYNYGSALQALATKIILCKLGYEGEILSLKGSIIKGRDIRLKKLLVIAIRMLMRPHDIKNKISVYGKNLNCPYSDESTHMFNKFYIKTIEPHYETWHGLKKLSIKDEYKAFLCGSDQIWNGDSLYVDPLYYLRFAPQKKRIAFAPSFGRDKIADYNRRIIRRYVNGIPHLSVREESGVQIIKDLTGRSALQLIDPTLILNKEEWVDYLHIANKNEKYILAYFLNKPSDNAKRFMYLLKEKTKFKIIFLPYNMKEKWFDFARPAGPAEFVEYINNAKYVCTDSFHGTAFSLNMEVPFFTFERQYGNASKQSSRVESLLKIVSLESRFNPNESEIDTRIDFKYVNKILEEERKKAKHYLIDALLEVD